MHTTDFIRNFIHNIIHSINKSIEEHRHLERSIYGRNFEIGCKILYESKHGGFFEGLFLGHVRDKSPDSIHEYKYRVLNTKTKRLELCPIYLVNGYID